MEKDTLNNYLGKMVKIQAREGRDGYPIYGGKVSNYDSDFVTLNPFMYIVERCTWKPEAERLNKFKAGTTNIQKTISRKCIESIEELVLEE